MDALIINAGKKCKKAFMPKCQELKDLRQFVSDIWMNKIKMSKKEKLEGEAKRSENALKNFVTFVWAFWSSARLLRR